MDSEITNKIENLFDATNRYRKSAEFKELLEFCRRFHYLSAYNAMLIQIQRPGARYVNTAKWWFKNHNLRIKPIANPMIILVPFGPVAYVFDVCDLEGDNLSKLPNSILHPFRTNGSISNNKLNCLISNLKYFGIKFKYANYGNQLAAKIQFLGRSTKSEHVISNQKNTFKITLPEYYLISVKESSSNEEVFASLVHELAHFFCEHLIAPNNKWWQVRNLAHNVEEFEAETVAWIICERNGINNPSEKYLSWYLENNITIPEINLECVLKAINKIEALLLPMNIKDGLLAKKEDYVKKQIPVIKPQSSKVIEPMLDLFSL
jgi:hypothetical protein